MTQLGEYQLHEMIGAGGMSTVYRGYQTKLKRNVAIKVLSPHLASEARYERRFEQEARMVANLQHSHIMPIFDYGVIKTTSFFVMPFLSGGTLVERIERQTGHERTLRDLDDVGLFVNQVASALYCAHSSGIIHRDVKPSNIIFDLFGDPFLSDFGIASLREPLPQDLSETGLLMGSYAYMAPELWYGEIPTPAVDQYAFALIIYALLTGHPAFGGEPSAMDDLIAKHAYETPGTDSLFARRCAPFNQSGYRTCDRQKAE